VEAHVEQRFGALQKSASEDDDARGAVADLGVLRLAELDEQAADLVLDLHELEDGGAVVGCFFLFLGEVGVGVVSAGPAALASSSGWGGRGALGRNPSTNATDGDVAVGRLQDLVHAFWAQARAQRARDGLGREDVGLERLLAAQARALLLLLLVLASFFESRARAMAAAVGEESVFWRGGKRAARAQSCSSGREDHGAVRACARCAGGAAASRGARARAEEAHR
jgi:hypothetical protein